LKQPGARESTRACPNFDAVAPIECADGRIFTGCKIKSSGYGSTLRALMVEPALKGG